MQSANLQLQLTEIRKRFLERINAEIPLMRELIDAINASKTDTSDIKNLLFYVHRYSGNGRTFGFPLISIRARTFEETLETILQHFSPLSIPAIAENYQPFEEILLQTLKSERHS